MAIPVGPHTARDLARFLDRVDVADDGCWNWQGHIRRSGYAEFSIDGASVLAHRFAFAEFVDDLVPGMHIDHLCRNRRCVNPAHLEQVTPAENNARSTSLSARNIAKTECDSGHPFSPANTYITKAGHRLCRRCNADRKAAARRAA